MKKIALFLILLLAVSSVAFAQAKKGASAANTGFVGISLNTIAVTPFSAPAARFGFGTWSLDVGGTLTNTAAGTAITIFGRGEIPISKIGSDVTTYWAPTLALNSPAGGGGSTTNISVFLGAEYMFAPQLALYFDMTAFTLTSAGGATTWTIGGNLFQIYSGGRLYL